MHMSSKDTSAGPMAWARLLVLLASRAYRAMLLTLTVIAVAPLALSWGSYVVESESMRPSVSVGDVVLARPTTTQDRIRVGRVYVFDDPSRPDRLLVHRIVERRDDGTFTTAGDANELTDSAPLKATGIQAQAILLTPYVGLPVHWLRKGQWFRLAAWLLLTMAAFVLATRRLDGAPPSRPGRRAGAAAAALVLAGATTTGTASAAFTDQSGNGSNRWTAGAFVQPYVAAVQADRPFGFWLLDEPSGAQYGLDRSVNNRTAQYYDQLTLGRPAGLPNNPGTALGVSGGRAILGNTAVTSPSSYSIELWFRTSSNAGGYLAGFENDRDDTWWNATADRLVTMEPSGRLSFGLWGFRSSDITTPRAYNDGKWHHLVVTSTSSRSSTIYVDGTAVASGTTSAVDNYLGFWRIGQGSTGFFNGLSSSFPGDIDNVSIFHSVLPATRVAAHWAAR